MVKKYNIFRICFGCTVVVCMEDVNLCANTVQLPLNVLIAGKGQYFTLGPNILCFRLV